MTRSNMATIVSFIEQEDSKTVRYRNIKPLIVDATQVIGPADFPTSGGVLHASPGDWVVRDSQGNVRIHNDLYFRSNYVPMRSAEPLEQFREQKPCGC